MVNAWFSGSFLPSSIRLVGRSLVLRPTFPPTPFPSVTSWDEWRVWVKDGGRNEDPTEAIRSEGNGVGRSWVEEEGGQWEDDSERNLGNQPKDLSKMNLWEVSYL